ncbi:hypothetical protein [Luteolibacter sp. LG18]|uniref:hypothetical protein n=1 Tax=Luteolibacter sp. LG18 TaxID=2819286 RepID=UPI002B2AA43F|nr:hypothetical protein llg_26420 [Luteolibacter sp. LG18]
MNAPDPLEALLAKLTPTPADPALMQRLRAANPDAPAKVIHFPLRRWLAIAAAIAVMAPLAWQSRETPAAPRPIATTPAAAPQPGSALESRQHLMDVTDLGIVTRGDRQPERLIRTTWIDEIYYVPSAGTEPVKEVRLREEVMPVSLTTY